MMKLAKESDLRAGFLFARNLTTVYSKSFTIATRMLPRDKRWPVYALYGFCRYADNLIDKPRLRSNDEVLHEINCLREEIKIAYRTGESEHPVLSAFIYIAKKYNIPPHYPDEFLQGVAMDKKKSRYKTFDDLYVFCYRVAGIVGLMMTYVLGYQSDNAFAYAEKLGVAMQLTNILRDIQEDKNMGRIYIPQEHLKKYSVCEDEIINEKMSDNLGNLMKYEIGLARKFYNDSAPGIPLLNKNVRFAISSATKIYGGILGQIEKNHYNPFIGRVYVSKLNKLGILMTERCKTSFNPIPRDRLDVAYD